MRTELTRKEYSGTKRETPSLLVGVSGGLVTKLYQSYPPVNQFDAAATVAGSRNQNPRKWGSGAAIPSPAYTMPSNPRSWRRNCISASRMTTCLNYAVRQPKKCRGGAILERSPLERAKGTEYTDFCVNLLLVRGFLDRLEGHIGRWKGQSCDLVNN